MVERAVLNDIFKTRLESLEASTTFFQKGMLQGVKSALESIHKSEFPTACGELYKVIELSNAFRNQINMYLTLEILPAFEDGNRHSLTLKEIQKKMEDAFTWANEVSAMSRQLQSLIMRKEVDEAGFIELITKIAQDERFSDIVNTFRVILQETEIYRVRHSKDLLSTIFRSLNLHPLIAECTRKLFLEGNYSQAIFEGCKAMINHVKDKSGQKTMKERDLMGEVFSVSCIRKNLEITKKPILQLNSLRTHEEIDEQEGFMHLFLGTVIGVRNPKAHGAVEQKDPYRTLEYLSLLSLLTKRIDEATVNC